jgi:anti-sigma B factor antagonist
MTINKSMENDKLTVNVQGRLDTATAPELEQALQESMADANELVIDLEGLEYMSSAGLRILLASHKAMSAKRGMKVINVNDIIAEIFEITGFSDILDIE